MHDTQRHDESPPAMERPSNACVTCAPPRMAGHWRLADRGYRTCSACCDSLREALRDISERFLQLDSTPGASGEAGTRGAPGFGSRPPASPHIITMTDWRSKSCEVSFDAVVYIRDENGEAIDRREVWYGADGRAHSEDPRPVRSVPGTLAALAGLIAEERDVRPPPARWVPDLVRWLDGHLDWITRQDMVVDVHRDFCDLLGQLRPVTGDRRVRVGTCPNTLDLGDTSQECGTPLYAPTRGETIHCPNPVCDRKWGRPDWEDLGRLLQAGAA